MKGWEHKRMDEYKLILFNQLVCFLFGSLNRRLQPFFRTKISCEILRTSEDANSDAQLFLPVKCLLPVVASSASCLLPFIEGALDFQMKQLKKLQEISLSPTWPHHHQHHPLQTFSAFLGLGRFELHFIVKNKVSPKPSMSFSFPVVDSLLGPFPQPSRRSPCQWHV